MGKKRFYTDPKNPNKGWVVWGDRSLKRASWYALSGKKWMGPLGAGPIPKWLQDKLRWK